MITALLCFFAGLTVGGGISYFERKKQRQYRKEIEEWLQYTEDPNKEEEK